MSTDSGTQSILYVGKIDEQFTRLCHRLQDREHSIIYAGGSKQAKYLLRHENFTLVAINQTEFRPDNINCLVDFIRSCQWFKLDVIKLQDTSVSVIVNHKISCFNNIFASASTILDIDREKTC